MSTTASTSRSHPADIPPGPGRHRHHPGPQTDAPPERPGLTGPWQVSGRSHIPFQDMIKFDYQYVAGWSLARDIEILIATIPVVLSGRGAY